MKRYICIHGHFYQPPRENPWLEAVELQDSAFPCHDWNERVTVECYRPNSVARILDGERRIVDIVNNYSKISFNFGPTLLAWMEHAASDVYETIIEADRISQQERSGHGNAIAQVYNHMIMPLANTRDKETQVLWGIRDFEQRFGRKPEGMWLAETAVDLETLEVLASQEIKFTILSPYQASRVRSLDNQRWKDVSNARIDPTRPYLLKLPSGKEISLFFYDAPISQAVAFEGILNRGEDFAGRLQHGFGQKKGEAQLINIATDGETYGHHHKHGEMALAYAAKWIENQGEAQLTNYGEYLELNPPKHEVEIFENTAWSCAHGVDRWQKDCGCNSGGKPGWNQKWRAPLRGGLNWLRDELALCYPELADGLLNDPWRARNRYIDVILDRSDGIVESFLREEMIEPHTPERSSQTLRLLEMQRNAMLMFTSCGWFFDDLTGIETVQVIQYASRAMQLAHKASGQSLEEEFVRRLGEARSNLPKVPTGQEVYDKFVNAARVNFKKVGAHVAISSLFEPYNGMIEVYGYTVERIDHEMLAAGRAKLAVGKMWVTSKVTRESRLLSYGVVYFGDHNVNGGVREFAGEEPFKSMVEEVKGAFSHGDLAHVIRCLDKYFLETNYSLKTLFRDEQRKVIGSILESALTDVDSVYRQLYDNYAFMVRFLVDLGIPLPMSFRAFSEFVVNANLRQALEAQDFAHINGLLEEAVHTNVNLDQTSLSMVFEDRLERLLQQMEESPDDEEVMDQLSQAARFIDLLPLELNLSRTQNSYHALTQGTYTEKVKCAEEGDESSQAWVERFEAIGKALGMRLPEITV